MPVIWADFEGLVLPLRVVDRDVVAPGFLPMMIEIEKKHPQKRCLRRERVSVLPVADKEFLGPMKQVDTWRVDAVLPIEVGQ